MRPRLTWKVRRWSEAAFVAENALIRRRYGDRIAEAVEMVAHMIDNRRDRPGAQDIKHTLIRIATQPADADLRRLDGYTEAELVTVANRLHRTVDLRTLTPDALAECARQALQRPRRGAGRSATDDLALLVVRVVMRAMPDTTAPIERDAILADALRACRLSSGQKTIERLRAKAGQIF